MHVEANGVAVVSGDTGCGKSTQVPQFILDSDPNSKIARDAAAEAGRARAR